MQLPIPFMIGLACLASAIVAMLAPTALDGGVASSIAFQRTDAAAAVLMASGAAIVAAALGLGRIAFAFAVAAAACAGGFAPLIGDNPRLGGFAYVLLALPAVAALVFAGARVALASAARQSAARVAAQAAEPDPPAAAPAIDRAPEDAAPQGAESDDATPDDLEAEDIEATDGEPDVVEAPPRPPPPATRPEPPPARLDPEVDEDAAERLQFMSIRAAEAGVSDEAAERWREISRLFPEYYPALNSEARVLFQQGQVEAARERLDRSLAIASDDDATLRLAARYAASAGDWAAAARHWAAAFEFGEMNVEAAAAYLLALTHSGRAEEARRLHHRFSDLWPGEGRLSAAGAFAAERLGADSEAAALWAAAAEADPSAFSHRRRAVRALLRLGRFREAATTAKTYQVDAANEPESVALVDHVRDTTRLKGAAADCVAVLTELGEKRPEVWAAFIDARLAGDDAAGAEMLYQAALKLDPGAVATLRRGALIAQREGAPEQKAERWAAAADAAPDDVAARQKAAQSAMDAGDLAEASRHLEDGLKLDPADENLLRQKAMLATREADWQGALDAWKAYGEQVGLDEQAVSGCASALRRMGRHRDAETLVARAIEEFGALPRLLIAHARNAEAARDPELMFERWRWVTTAAPENPNGWIGLVRVLVKQGETAAAIDAVDAALAALPDDGPFRQSRHVARLLRRRDAAKPATGAGG